MERQRRAKPFSMWKRVLANLACAVGIMLLFGIVYNFFSKTDEEANISAEEEIEKIFVSATFDDDEERLIYLAMDERQMQETIHSMSHQKVKAKQKWGRILITQERIAVMIETAENNQDEWEHADIYLDILNRWYEGDFSKADEDHNAVWELQGGNVGKAHGLLSPVEERDYLLIDK